MGASPTGVKLPKTVVEPQLYNDRKAAWHVSRLRLANPYGWHELPLERIQYIQEKLAHFEKKTWNEIFVIEKKHNHAVSVADLRCPLAKSWMRKNMPDQDFLWTLRLSGPERVWGIYSQGVYQLLFWDPEHNILPTQK